MTQDQRPPTIPAASIDAAEENVRDILSGALEHRPEDAVLVVSYTQCELAVALT